MKEHVFNIGLARVLFAISILFLMQTTSSHATTYRGSTYTEVHNITVNATNATDREWFWIELPEVSCLPEDTYRDCVDDDYSMLRNNLLVWANPSYMVPASAGWQPSWKVKGVGTMNLAMQNIDTTDVQLAPFGCSFVYNNEFMRCRSAWGEPKLSDPGHFNNVTIKSMGVRVYYGDFYQLPNGQYTTTLNGSFFDFGDEYLILNISIRINVTVERSDGSDAAEPAVKLHALEGETLPINFFSLDPENQYGTGNLDFCLEAEDYSNLSVNIVGQGFAYPDNPDAEFLYQVRTPGVFVLANNSESVTDAANAIIRFSMLSRTLGMTSQVTDLSDCGVNSFAFCSNLPKTYDFSPLPDSPAPGGGTCKRFDISVVTRPFNVYQVQAGDYSASFYLNVDEVP